MEYNNSDKFGVVLACLAGVMAIILFLIEKTPRSVLTLLILMVLLAVYPVMHFIRRASWRAVALLAVMVCTVLFGYYVRPHKEPAKEKQITVTRHDVEKQLAPEQIKTDARVSATVQHNVSPGGKQKKTSSPATDIQSKQLSTPKKTPYQDNSVHIDRGASVEQNSKGDCSPNIIGGSATVNCAPPEPKVKISSEDVPVPAGEAQGWSSYKAGFMKPTNKLRVTIETDTSIMLPTFILTFDKPFLDARVYTSYEDPNARDILQGYGSTDDPSVHTTNIFRFTMNHPASLPPNGKLFVDVWSMQPIKLVKWERGL